MLICADEGEDGVFWVFEDCMFVVCVGFGKGDVVKGVIFTHFLPPEQVEVGGVVIHLGGEFIS